MKREPCTSVERDTVEKGIWTVWRRLGKPAYVRKEVALAPAAPLFSVFGVFFSRALVASRGGFLFLVDVDAEDVDIEGFGVSSSKTVVGHDNTAFGVFGGSRVRELRLGGCLDH